MFTNLEHHAQRTGPAGRDVAFVREVTVRTRSPRNRRVERTMVVCWVLIAIKCALVSWVVHKYQLPVGAWWVNGPTLVFALFASCVYFGRD